MNGKLSFPNVSDFGDFPKAHVEEMFEGNEDIWRKLADEKTSIAVVGNSPELKNSGNGSLIDSHDIVIRFNSAVVDTKYIADSGSKTDLIFLNQALLARKNIGAIKKKDIIVTGPDWVNYTYGKRAAVDLLDQDCQIGVIPTASRKALIETLWATPSSGISISFAIHEMRGSLKDVSCFGFSFTDQIGSNPKQANYFRVSKPSARHNWKGEANLFKKLVAGAKNRTFRRKEKTRNALRKYVVRTQGFSPNA